MAPSSGATAARAWGGMAGVLQRGEVYRDPNSPDLANALAEVYEVPMPATEKHGLAVLAEWRRQGLPSLPGRLLPAPMEAGSPLHRRDAGPPEGSRGLAMRGPWQQALRDFVMADEQLNSQVLLFARKILKGGGGSNLNFALSTMMDMSWSAMVAMWEAWQDGRLSTVFDAQNSETFFKAKYHDLIQQFNMCRGAWLEEISDMRDQKRSRIWTDHLQKAYEAGMNHNVFRFVPEEALDEEQRPYFKAALQECLKMALTAGADESSRLLLEKIELLEAELAAALAEIERLKDEDRDKEERPKEYYKKPLPRPRPNEPIVQEVAVKAPSAEKEAQTDFNEPTPVAAPAAADDQESKWRLEAEFDKNSRLLDELRKMEALLRSQESTIAELQKVKQELEQSLGNAMGSAERAGRLAQLEKEREVLLEKVRQLKGQLDETEAENQNQREQLASALASIPKPAKKEPRQPSKPIGVQTTAWQPEKPPPQIIVEKRPEPVKLPAMLEVSVQTEPAPKPQRADATVQVDLREPLPPPLPPPPPGDSGEELRRLMELNRQLQKQLDLEQDRFRQLELEMKKELEKEHERYQELELETKKQLEMGLSGLSQSQEQQLRQRTQLEQQRDEARRLLQLEREKTERLEAALQDLRNQLENLRKKLKSLGADTSEVDRVIDDVCELNVTKAPCSQVFQRLWSDAVVRLDKVKELESQHFIYDASSYGAVLKLQPAAPIPAGSWLFGDAAHDAICPCCGRPCNSSLLTSGTWQASRDVQTPSAEAASEGRRKSIAPHLRKPGGGARLTPDPLAPTKVGHCPLEDGQVDDLVVGKSLLGGIEEALPRQAPAGATCADQPSEDLPPQEPGRCRQATTAVPTPRRAVVEARATSIAGGLSFAEHCRRLRDGPATQDAETVVKTASKSVQLSHLLLGAHERKADDLANKVGDVETPASTQPRGQDALNIGWPVSNVLSAAPGTRPASSSAPGRCSAPLLPMVKDAPAALHTSAGPKEEAAATVSSMSTAAMEMLAPQRPSSRRWFGPSSNRSPQAQVSGGAEASSYPSSCGLAKGPGTLQRSRSSCHVGTGTSQSQAEGARGLPVRTVQASSTPLIRDRCAMRACALSSKQ